MEGIVAEILFDRDGAEACAFASSSVVDKYHHKARQALVRAGGDTIHAVMHECGVGFPEAVEMLAARQEV